LLQAIIGRFLENHRQGCGGNSWGPAQSRSTADEYGLSFLRQIRQGSDCQGKNRGFISKPCGTYSTIFLPFSCATVNSPDPPQVGQGSTWVPVVVIVIVLPPPHRQHLVMNLPSKKGAGPCPDKNYRLELFLPFSFLLRHGSFGRGTGSAARTAPPKMRAAMERRVRTCVLPSVFFGFIVFHFCLWRT